MVELLNYVEKKALHHCGNYCTALVYICAGTVVFVQMYLYFDFLLYLYVHLHLYCNVGTELASSAPDFATTSRPDKFT